MLALLLGAALGLPIPADARGGEKPGPADRTAPLTRPNKASAVGRPAAAARLEVGLTERDLRDLLGTDPVETRNGELLWVLSDAILLTARPGDTGEIVCWSFKPLRRAVPTRPVVAPNRAGL